MLFKLPCIGCAAALLAACASVHAFASDVTWETQAERLQNVSATLLDSVPFAEPVQRSLSVEARAGVSFLPKVNPRVGAKSEKVPSAPLHAIPSLQLNARLDPALPFASSIGAQAWVGYLPAGGEKLFGIDAKLKQWAAGGAFSGAFAFGSFDPYFSVGGQHSSADLEGAITAKGANDSFKAKTLALFVAPGVVHRPSGLWANVLVGTKRTKSTFEIPSDGTRFEITDNLKDSNLPLLAQAGAGWLHASGLQAGAALLYVPKRLLMPRLLLSYQYAL